MKLRIAALALGTVSGFVFGWARLTDPNTFHRMLALDSPRVYLLMGAAVAVAFPGARLLRGRRALLTGERIGWSATRPTRSHIIGSVLFGIGWGISEACPGPTAAQLGARAACSRLPSPRASSLASNSSPGSPAPPSKCAAPQRHRNGPCSRPRCCEECEPRSRGRFDGC